MKIISKKPFISFKKKNFLTKNFYRELENNFPYKKLKSVVSKNHERFFFSSFSLGPAMRILSLLLDTGSYTLPPSSRDL